MIQKEWTKLKKGQEPNLGDTVIVFHDWEDHDSMSIIEWTEETQRWADWNSITYWMLAPIPPSDSLIEDNMYPDNIEEEELPVCTCCGGSGQGSHESVQCWKCKGSGVIYPPKDYDI